MPQVWPGWMSPKVGMASVEPKVATYTEFAEVVLPRIKRHPASEWLPCRPKR